MKIDFRQLKFEMHFHYWMVHLKLDKRYRIILKQDNRIDCFAFIEWKSRNIYMVTYNTLRMNREHQIVSTILHEIGHLFNKDKSDTMNEAEAEYYALKVIKKERPDLYKSCLRATKSSITDKTIDLVHKEGYKIALKRLGEL